MIDGKADRSQKVRRLGRQIQKLEETRSKAHWAAADSSQAHCLPLHRVEDKNKTVVFVQGLQNHEPLLHEVWTRYYTSCPVEVCFLKQHVIMSIHGSLNWMELQLSRMLFTLDPCSYPD